MPREAMALERTFKARQAARDLLSQCHADEAIQALADELDYLAKCGRDDASAAMYKAASLACEANAHSIRLDREYIEREESIDTIPG